MKALFYTATAVFITLAGVIAYFALQPPTSGSGARIVLDIDAGAMPTVETGSNARPALDPYAGEEDDKPADAEPSTARADASPVEDQGQANAATLQDNSAGPQAVPSHSEPSHALASPTLAPPSNTSPAERAQIPAPPPGTALAGLSQNRPLFREIKPEQQVSASLTQLESQPASETASATQAQEPGLPGAHLALPAPEQDASRPTAGLPATAPAVPAPSRANPAELAGLAPADVAPAPVVLPPPPIPARRPADIPAAGERVAAAATGGGQYAATDATAKPARVALLLRGIGRNDQDAADAIGSLPSAVSLGFWPYAQSGQRLASRAREKGHEVIVQVPLEPADYPASSAGPDTLLTTAAPEQNAERLQAVLKRFEGHSGVTNLMGGKMLHAKGPLKIVMEDIKARGLLYVGESNNSHGTAREVAKEINLRFGAADVLIDAQPAPEAIDKALARLVSIARQRGSAIGIGSANVVTVQQVHEWSDTLAAQGITLVPVGVLAQTPGSS
jgi:uncharacterized protein